MSSEEEQAWRAIYRAHTRLAPTIDQRLKAAVGLSYSEYEALSQLKAASGPVKMADLASYVAVTRTHASRLIDSLELKGLAKRESNPDDGRSFLVAITNEGAQRLQATSTEVESVFAELFGNKLPGPEVRHLTAWVDQALAKSD